MIVFRPTKINDVEDILEKQNININDRNFLDSIFFAAEVDNKLIGIGRLEMLNNIGIISVILKPTEHDILIGLIKSILNYADRRNIKRIYTSTSDCIEFYKSLGFNIICKELIEDRIKKSSLAKNKNDTIMVLNLTGYFDKPCHCKNT